MTRDRLSLLVCINDMANSIETREFNASTVCFLGETSIWPSELLFDSRSISNASPAIIGSSYFVLFDPSNDEVRATGAWIIFCIADMARFLL